MALEFNAEAVNEAKDEAAKLLNVLTADIVTIAKYQTHPTPVSYTHLTLPTKA